MLVYRAMKILHTLHSIINYTKFTIFSAVSKSRPAELCMTLSKADKFGGKEGCEKSCEKYVPTERERERERET